MSVGGHVIRSHTPNFKELKSFGYVHTNINILNVFVDFLLFSAESAEAIP